LADRHHLTFALVIALLGACHGHRTTRAARLRARAPTPRAVGFTRRVHRAGAAFGEFEFGGHRGRPQNTPRC
jgi:hypothetical protein